MTHEPPPSKQRCFSASRAQEKGVVMRADLRSLGGFEGGMQVATVKKSTSLRMKMRGKVPPRLETLKVISIYIFKATRKVTYVASNVIYVPPTTGSAILAWKAAIATNMMVFIEVEKTCSAITTAKYHVVTPSFGKIMTVAWASMAAINLPTKAQHHI